MHVCVYVRLKVCVCMYVNIYLREYVCKYVCIFVTDVCNSVHIYVYVCLLFYFKFVCMHV